MGAEGSKNRRNRDEEYEQRVAVIGAAAALAGGLYWWSTRNSDDAEAPQQSVEKQHNRQRQRQQKVSSSSSYVSNLPSDREKRKHAQFTENQVGQLLEEQKMFYEQKMMKMKNVQQNQSQIQQQQSAAGSFAQTRPTSGASVYPRPQYTASASNSPNPQTYGAPVYPRVQSVATGSSAHVSPQAYGTPVYPSLPPSSYVSTSGSTPMPVFISSPSAPPLESMDRHQTPYNQNNLQQKTTMKNVPAQTQHPSNSAGLSRPPMQSQHSIQSVSTTTQNAPNVAVSSRPPFQSPTTKQPQPGTSNSSDYVFVNRNGEAERSQPPASQSRDRSASRSRQKINKEKNQEDEEIKCPTCKRTFGLTIYNCPNGHSSCNDCKRSGRGCGICYLNITDTRNITLEAYLAERKAHCPHSEDGCCLFIKLADMESHIKECPFREMTCPIDSIVGKCSWKGKLSEVESHFEAFHPMQREGNVDTEMHLNITGDGLSSMNATHIARLVVIGSYNFIFHLRVSQIDQKIYATVWMLGTAFSASKWTYELHIYNKRQPRRKYQHIDVCHSASTKLDEIFNEAKCVAIPMSHASTFVNENKLTFKFYIKKDFNEKNSRNNRGRGRGAHRR